VIIREVGDKVVREERDLMKKFARAVLRPFEELDENPEVVGRDDESLGARNLDDVVKGIVAVDRPQQAREVEGRLAA
jgi:hypothetical protein